MCVRGLMLLMLNEQFADYMGQAISEKILTHLIVILGSSIHNEQRLISDLGEHIPAVQYISIMPSKMLHEFVMQLQNILTLNII